MKKLYVYADEATFLRGSKEILGTGIFISQIQIDQAVVNDAMKLLLADPDFDKKMDKRTADYGYFHASEDSKNAHSHFCRTIVEKASGNFVYSYLSKKNRAFRSEESLYRLTLKLVSSKFMDEPYDVEMIVEERMGFGQNSISRFLDSLNREYALLANNQPGIINIFSKISITTADKKQPGLQIVDFMLWAMNRSMMIPKNNTWKDRLNLRLNDFVRTEDYDQSSGNYYINKSAIDYNDLDNVRCKYPYHVPTDIPKEGATVLDYYQYIENIITHLNTGEIPEHCIHWKESIQKSHEIITGNKFVETSLKFICYTFIYIFDTMPVYKELADKDEEDWLDILFAKRLAGIVVANGAIHNARTRDAILRWKWGQKILN